jgi:hypothetical protein
MKRRDEIGDRREKKTFPLRVSGLAKRTADDMVVTKAVAELCNSHGNSAGTDSIRVYIAADEYES